MPGLLVAGLVFVFPNVAVSTVGGASYVYVVLVLAGLIRGWRWGELGREEKWLLLGFVAVLAIMALSLLVSQDVETGLRWLERYARIATIGLIYPMLVRFERPFHRWFGAGVVVAVFLLAGQAWYEVTWRGVDRVAGAYHHIVFGDVAVLWGCVGVLFLLSRGKGWIGLAAVAATAAAATFASAFSGARGSWVFLVLSPLVLGVLYRHELARSAQARRAAAALVLVVAGVTVWQRELVAERIDLAVADLEAFSEDPASLSSWGIRLNLWRNALLLTREHPLSGTGLGSFQAEMRDMVVDGRSLSPHVVDYGNAHSIYLDALSNAGILGLIAMVGAYLALPLRVFATRLSLAVTPDERFCAMGGVVTVLAFATFGLSEVVWVRNVFVNTYVVCIAVFLAGGFASRARPEEVQPE